MFRAFIRIPLLYFCFSFIVFRITFAEGGQHIMSLMGLLLEEGADKLFLATILFEAFAWRSMG